MIRIPLAGSLAAALVIRPERFAVEKVAASHPGLALDRFLPFEYNPQAPQGPSQRPWCFWSFDSEQKGPWLRDFANEANKSYQATDAAWKAWSRRQADLLRANGTEVRVIRPRWRWVVGLGGGTVLETGLTLHHVYGIPYVPGSALKGLTQAFVTLELEGPVLAERIRRVGEMLPGSESARQRVSLALFGETDPKRESAAGEVSFLGAIPLPDSPPRLKVDVMTPHFPAYYGGRNPDGMPLEVEDPTPVPFLVVTGGVYRLAVARRRRQGPGGVELLELALDLCLAALEEMGVGGKTAKGYGYFREDRGA